jgi:ribosomal-protein-alanine N-acetyltransferase
MSELEGFSLEVETRWMKRSDITAAIRIMNSGGASFDEKSMDRLVSKSGVVCVVAEVDNNVVGIVAYDVSRVSKVKIIYLVVDESNRRNGVGRVLMEFVTSKLNKKRSKIELSLSEYNLDGQLFLKSMGFRAVSVVAMADGSSDYKFRYRLEDLSPSDS